MNRVLRKTFKSAALASCALSLAGCFNNMASLEGGSTLSSQSNAILNDSGFANETGPIDTNAVLIGTYNDSSSSGFGIMVDLEKSLLATLGGTSLQAILDGIDTNVAMQARSVVVHLPAFGIKGTTTLGKIAAGNNKKIRNIMNIRPRLSRIDLTTSALEIPASPSVLQLKNSNKTVITYGGKIEGDYVRRMTLLIPYAGVNAGYLPSSAVPNFGDGYPTAAPQESVGSVKLIRVSTAIRDRFAKMITNAPYGQAIYNSIQSDAIKSITQTYDSLALAVHLKLDANGNQMHNLDGTNTIEAAYLININPANSSGPETFPFCHSGYDSQDQTATYGTNADEVDFTHPLACNCPTLSCAAKTYSAATGASPAAVAPTTSQFVDPWPVSATPTTPPTIIKAAIDASAAAPTSGAIILSTDPMTLNDFVLSHE